MKILIATDAWTPQISGVVTTLKNTKKELEKLNHNVKIVHPYDFYTIPTHYPGIPLAIPFYRQIKNSVNEFKPDILHIAVEGTVGAQTRRFCVKNNVLFSTAFHTNFQDYGEKYFYVPKKLTWKILKWFHSKSSCVMYPTQTIYNELNKRKFNNLKLWSRGVDSTLFYPRPKTTNEEIALYVGRVSPEKNIDDFLNINLPCKKHVVGDGPLLNHYKNKYKDVTFLGALHGEELAQAYSNASVFVFPSKTDTFGLVIIEALSCGVPVAAYPVQGPIDILKDRPGAGFISENLKTNILNALKKSNSKDCLRLAGEYTWEKSTQQFLSNIENMK